MRASLARVAAVPIALVLLVGATAVPAAAGPAISGTVVIEPNSTNTACDFTVTVKNLDPSVTSLSELQLSVYVNTNTLTGGWSQTTTTVTNGTAIMTRTDLAVAKLGKGNFDRARVRDQSNSVSLEWPRLTGSGRLRVTNHC